MLDKILKSQENFFFTTEDHSPFGKGSPLSCAGGADLWAWLFSSTLSDSASVLMLNERGEIPAE